MAGLVYVLTGLAILIVLLTRLRWRQERVAGRSAVSDRWALWHTLCGVLAALTWTTFLVGTEDSWFGGAGMGIVGLGLWCLVAILGLVILARWLPSRGRHAGAGAEDGWSGWSGGPALSVLAHGGMLLITLAFTWAYLLQKV